MAKTIDVNTDKIEDLVQQLRAIDTGSTHTSATDMQGSKGNAPQALHGVEAEYEVLTQSLRSLIDGTADFFDNLIAANKAADNEAAHKFAGR